MEPAIGVLGLVLLFAATHIGLATHDVRTRLVARFGESGFFAMYSLVATLTFALLLAYYAAHRFEGAPGLALGAVPLVRAVLLAVIAAGCALAAAGLAAYPRMPVALFGRDVRPPYGVTRITRHPFFVGTALVGIAHVLLAPHLAGAVLMGGLAAGSIVGAHHQDAKHLRKHGQPYAEYLAATSFLPFAAIVAGRQRLVWRELPLKAAALGLAVAVGLRAVHASLFAAGGRWTVLVVAAGGGVATLQSWLRARRPAAPPALETVPQ